jgi:hypothetical protein
VPTVKLYELRVYFQTVAHSPSSTQHVFLWWILKLLRDSRSAMSSNENIQYGAEKDLQTVALCPHKVNIKIVRMLN